MSNVFHCVNQYYTQKPTFHPTARILLKLLTFSVVKAKPYSRYLEFEKYKKAESPVTEGNRKFEDVQA